MKGIGSQPVPSMLVGVAEHLYDQPEGKEGRSGSQLVQVADEY